MISSFFAIQKTMFKKQGCFSHTRHLLELNVCALLSREFDFIGKKPSTGYNTTIIKRKIKITRFLFHLLSIRFEFYDHKCI